MSYQAELLAIESRFLEAWTATPVALDEGGPMIDPNSFAIVPQPSASSWVRLSVRSADERQASLGAEPLYRNQGLILVSIFTPPAGGHAAGRGLADAAGAIFRGAYFEGITCRGASVRDLGETEGGWIMTGVDVAYFRDATH